jgi:hypothetical protein
VASSSFAYVGKKVWTHGIRPEGGVVQDAKAIVNPDRNPYIPDSDCPSFIHDSAVEQVEDEFRGYAAVLADPATPVRSLEVIVSDAAASPFFEGLLLKFGIPGRAIVP